MYGIEIEMKHGVVNYVDIPLCTASQIDTALHQVALHQEQLFAWLPDGHTWKAKSEHMNRAHEAEQPIIDSFQKEISPINFRLLDFIFRVHDLGRVIEGAAKSGTLPPGRTFCGDHAEESVRLLHEWGVLDVFDPSARQLIKYVIRHHVGTYVPQLATVEDGSLEAAQVLFTCLLRDADKYLNFRDRTSCYLLDSHKKSVEIAMHGLGGELGRIEPTDFLETFRNGNIPNKSNMVSYEAYMLYFLSWIYDVNLQTILAAIVRTGAIHQLIAYFHRQLPSEEAQGIEASVTRYLAQHGLSLIA